jgi:hypothetical protein
MLGVGTSPLLRKRLRAEHRSAAERQLAAALERHREVLASMQPGSWRDVREL